jgi:hypothetical protein
MSATVEISMSSNAAYVTVGNLQLWFSYCTCIACRERGRRYVSENAWAQTTGRHLNAIDGGDKKARLPRAAFEAKVAEILAAHKLDLPL